MSQYNLIQNGESGLDVRNTLNDLLTAANSGFTTVHYLLSGDTFPSGNTSGDFTFITSDGTSGGTVTQQYIYDGQQWKDFTISGSDYKYSLEFWTDPVNGDNTNNGAYGSPKKTINATLDTIGQGSLIHLVRGQYNESVDFFRASTTIQGVGRNSVITGTTTSTSTGQVLNGIRIVGNSSFDNISTIPNYYNDMTFDAVLGLSGDTHQIQNCSLLGNVNIAATNTSIYDTQIGGLSLTSSGTLLTLQNCTTNSITITSGRFIANTLQSTNPNATITIGAGVVYLLNNVSGYNLVISPTAIKYETFLESIGESPSEARLLAAASTESVRLINPPQLTGATKTLVFDNNNVIGFVTGATSGNLSGDYLPLSGGTVTGNTIFTSGLTASTLNLTAIGSGTSITNLGISASGNIVSGNTIFEAFTGITRGRAVRLGENGKIYPMDFVGVENQPIVGIAQTSGVAGTLVQVAIEGEFSTTTTGLTPSYNYYASPDGSITLTGETYIGTAIKSDTIQVWFGSPNGVITPSLSVIDNTITNPDDITTPGRYIVPVSGNTGVFVGEANDYADYDGSSFTFTIPTNGDKALITTGPNAGNVYLFTSGATSGWTLSSQSTVLQTSNWSSGVSYKQNDLVIYQNFLYQANGNIPANTAFTPGTSGTTWKPINNGVIPEYGSVYPTSGSTKGGASTGTTYVDLPGSTLNIPSAGTYRVYYNMSVTNTTVGGNTSFLITDSSNTAYNGSAGNTKESAGDTIAMMASQEIFITVTTPTSLKMRWKTNNTGTSTLVNNNTASNSVFGYEKIAGFAPVVGQTTSSRSATLFAAIPGGGAVGTDITGVTFSVGTIPLSNSGVWTLTAGVTYQIECSVTYDAGGTNQFQGDTFIQFVDATTNTALPNQNGATTMTPFFTTRGLTRNGYNIFQYTPSTNQTIKLRATFQNSAGSLNAQTFINQLGTTNTSAFTGVISPTWNIGNTYPLGTMVVNNGILYQANSLINAGTAFTTGTSGATWRPIDAVPSGGTTNQVLRKVNNTNYNTEWATPGVPLWEFPGGGITIGGTTTAPTIGGTIFRNEQFYRQVGPRAWEVSLALDKDAGGNAGSGDYLFSLPVACPDFQEFGIQPFWTLDVASNASRLQRYAIANSYGSIHHNVTPSTTVQIIVYDARRYRVLIHDEGAAIRCMGSGWFEMDKSLGLMLQFQYQSV